MASISIENYAFALVNDSPDLIGFALIDAPFSRIYVNPAGLEMLGLKDVDDWNAHDVADMFDDSDVRHLLDNVIPALKSGKTWVEEADIRNIRTGTKTRVHRRMFPIYDHETGEIIAFGTISRDITGLKQAEQQAKGANMQLAVRGERERIARDLHDSTLQQLITFNYEVEALRSYLREQHTPEEVSAVLDRLSATASDAISETRRSLSALRSIRFDGSSLEEALRAEVHSKAVVAGYKASLVTEGEPRVLPEETQDEVLHVTQEALTNAWKHGKAENVTVTLRFNDANVVVQVCDDGMGFDPADTGPRLDSSGLGLTGMRERVAATGGTLDIKSAPGEGCSITFTLPA